MAFYTRPLGLNIAPFLPDAIFNAVTYEKDSLLFNLVYNVIPNLTWPQLVGGVLFPWCALKQIINGVQFWKAAKVLTDMDLMDRRKRQI